MSSQALMGEVSPSPQSLALSLFSISLSPSSIKVTIFPSSSSSIIPLYIINFTPLFLVISPIYPLFFPLNGTFPFYSSVFRPAPKSPSSTSLFSTLCIKGFKWGNLHWSNSRNSRRGSHCHHYPNSPGHHPCLLLPYFIS